MKQFIRFYSNLSLAAKTHVIYEDVETYFVKNDYS